MRKIILLGLLFFVFTLSGCIKKGKKKDFLYLGEVKEDEEIKLEYNSFSIRDNDLYISFDIKVYDSTIKSIREFTVSGDATIKEVYINQTKIEDNNSMNLEDNNTIGIVLSTDSINEFLNVYLYHHEMVTLYISSEAVPGYESPIDKVTIKN